MGAYSGILSFSVPKKIVLSRLRDSLGNSTILPRTVTFVAIILVALLLSVPAIRAQDVSTPAGGQLEWESRQPMAHKAGQVHERDSRSRRCIRGGHFAFLRR